MKRQAKKTRWRSDELRAILGANLKIKMREEFGNGYGPKLLHDRTGIAKSTIQRIEKGEVGVTLDNLALIAMALHCDPADLLRRTDQE